MKYVDAYHHHFAVTEGKAATELIANRESAIQILLDY